MPARAEEETLQLSLELAWEGYVRTPGWTELQVRLRNEGSNWQGELRITDSLNQVVYHQRLALPAHALKQYRIPLYVDSSQIYVQLALVGDDGRVVRTRQVIHSVGEGASVCAVVAAPDGEALTRNGGCGVAFLLSDVASLPETPMAWDNVDVLFVEGVSTAELTLAQREAMAVWVGLGGRLIASGGASLAQVLAGLPDALRIAEAGSTQVVSSLPLVGASVQRYPVTTLLPAGGATPSLVLQSGTPLVVQKGVGQGQVDVVGFSLAPLVGTDWFKQLLGALTVPRPHLPTLGLSPSQLAPPVSNLTEIPSSSITTLVYGMFILPVYVLLMGPGTLFLVRRLKRPVLAWLLFPFWLVLTLLGQAVMLRGGFARTFPLVNDVGIVVAPAGNMPARAIQGTAIYAPRRRVLKWYSDGFPRPLRGAYREEVGWYSEGDPFAADVFFGTADEHGQAEMRVPHPLGVLTWGTEGLYTPPRIQVTWEIRERDQIPQVMGTLQSEVTLHHSVLLFNSQMHAITLARTITGGIPVSITRPISKVSQLGWELWDQTSLCVNMLAFYQGNLGMGLMGSGHARATMEGNQCFLMGTAEIAPFPTSGLGGTYHAHSCIVYAVPCPKLARGTGEFRVLMLPASGEPEQDWINPDGVVSVSSEMTLDYVLPPWLEVGEVLTVTLIFQPTPWGYLGSKSSSWLALRTIAFWDYEREMWREQEIPRTREPLLLPASETPRYFSPEGVMRVRLIPDGNTELLIHLVAYVR